MNANFKVGDFVMTLEGEFKLEIRSVKEFKTKPTTYVVYDKNIEGCYTIEEPKLKRWISPEEKAMRNKCVELAEKWYQVWYVGQNKRSGFFIESNEAMQKMEVILKRNGFDGSGVRRGSDRIDVEVGGYFGIVKLHFEMDYLIGSDNRKTLNIVILHGETKETERRYSFDIQPFVSKFEGDISMSSCNDMDTADAFMISSFLQKVGSALYEFKGDFSRLIGFKKENLLREVADALYGQIVSNVQVAAQ